MMLSGKRQTGIATLAVVALALSFAGGAAYGQRSASAERPSARYVKLSDGRLVRPLSASVQAKVDAVVAGAPQLNPAAASLADLEAGRKLCEAKCAELSNHPSVAAEECEPNPTSGSGSGLLGTSVPLSDKPCKSTKTVTVTSAMLVDLCRQGCFEKYQVK